MQVNLLEQSEKEYFEWLLNVDDGRRAALTKNGLGVMHELANVEDARKVVKKLKG